MRLFPPAWRVEILSIFVTDHLLKLKADNFVANFELCLAHEASLSCALLYPLQVRFLIDFVDERLFRVYLFEVLQDVVELALLQILVAVRPVSDLPDLIVVKLEVLLHSQFLRVDDRMKIILEADFAGFLFAKKFLLMVGELHSIGALFVIDLLNVLKKCMNRVCVFILHEDLPKLTVNTFSVLFVVLFTHFDVNFLLFFKRNCVLLSVELFIPWERAKDQLVNQENQRLNVILEASLLAVELPQGREH